MPLVFEIPIRKYMLKYMLNTSSVHDKITVSNLIDFTPF